jgi:hypothetical protein
MKQGIICSILILIFNVIMAVEKMDERFLIQYGDIKAPLKVVEYISFSCPHFIKLFREFPKIKEDFIDKGIIYFTFHPVPKDLTTIRALHCFEMLTEREKQVFLEGLIEYLDQNPMENEENLCQVMQDFLTCLKKEKLKLDDFDYLKKTSLMEKAYLFVTQKEQVNALPTVEMNGLLFLNDLPNYDFFSEAVSTVLGEKR